MSLINSLRNRFGTITTILIAFAIIAFVIGDFLASRGSGQQDVQGNIVGSVNDTVISKEHFETLVQQARDNYTSSQGKPPTTSVMSSYRSSIWNQLIEKYLLRDESEKLGLRVTIAEMQDMVSGEYIDEGLKTQFKDEDGNFDKAALMETLERLKNAPKDQRSNWAQYEEQMRDQRIKKKFESLFTKSEFVPTFIAKKHHKEKNQTLKIKFCYVPYYSIPDSLVDEPTESEIAAFMDKNLKKYQQEDSREIKYISIKKNPSSADTLAFNQEMDRIKTEFMESEADSVFAMVNTEATKDFFKAYHIGQLPTDLKSKAKELKSGEIIGPKLESDKYVIYKVSNITEGKTRVAKASHILFKPETKDDEESEKKAKKEAKEILNKIIAGASFEEMAKEHGSDGTASSGGDLGWGEEGKTWVKEFSEPIFKTKKLGVIKRVIKSQFGYHLIKVTGLPENTSYEVAKVEKEISSSSQTLDSLYQVTTKFIDEVDDLDSFEEKAEEYGYTVETGKNLSLNSNQVGTVSNARALVRWAFLPGTSLQSISDIRDGDLDDHYLVACVTKITEKGDPELDDVRDVIKSELLNSIKGKQIADKLKETQGTTFEEIAGNYGKDASVQTSKSLKYTDTSLAIVGYSPEAIGIAFGLEKDEITEPIPIKSGVIIMKLLEKDEVQEIADYTSIKEEEVKTINSSTSRNITTALKEYAEIEDLRHLSY